MIYIPKFINTQMKKKQVSVKIHSLRSMLLCPNDLSNRPENSKRKPKMEKKKVLDPTYSTQACRDSE